MSDKVIVICVVPAMVAIIAIMFICRAIRYGKIPGASATKGEPEPQVEPDNENG